MQPPQQDEAGYRRSRMRLAAASQPASSSRRHSLPAGAALILAVALAACAAPRAHAQAWPLSAMPFGDAAGDYSVNENGDWFDDKGYPIDHVRFPTTKSPGGRTPSVAQDMTGQWCMCGAALPMLQASVSGSLTGCCAWSAGRRHTGLVCQAPGDC
jgi:hypothetical protein